ncbi:multiheme c-type cytochrome [Agaribacterium haliotis]|uniref:multiheme c-type cytochrome n=1 Tax=Agaribacterium haliotis TaxID=2013869 RepID=UPI001177B254|nr:multiheme c-type cytochrome [Agaribacterium haliotis]
MKKFISVSVFLCLGLSWHCLAEPSYVGVENCSSCHQQQYELWLQSDHFKAMAEVSEKTVLAPFDGRSLVFHGINWRFSREGEHYFFEGPGADGGVQKFPVLYTFGHYPLQQYLVDIGNGHLQATNIAWDSRSKEQGGQRWIHLQPDEKMHHEHPFFWARSFQNWNGHCADCHSTNLQKNYDASKHSYATTWSEINVACEACHGPGSEHVKLAKQGKIDGASALAYTSDASLLWAHDGKNTEAKASGSANTSYISMCGGCHSRRMQIADANSIDDYHNKYLLQDVDDRLYHNDGQILDEVYVLGSFMQSKMQHAGVQCMDCHDAHSGKLKAEPNAVCAQCHLPSHYDNKQHSGHDFSAGKQPLCVDCHMAEETYMQVDDRRDHRFNIPNPELSERYDTPLACLSCHGDKDASWAKAAFKKNNWSMQIEPWVSAWNQALSRDSLALSSLAAEAVRQDLPAQIQALLLRSLESYPSQQALDVLQSQLDSEQVLVRRAAVSSLSFVPVQMRWPLLQQALTDSSAAVRFEAASQVVGIYSELPAQAKSQAQAALNEYRQALSYSEDFASTQVALARLYSAEGKLAEADGAYQLALKQAPAYAPALLAYAEFVRQQPKLASADELALLSKAKLVVPESAAVNHALGLYYVRKRNYSEALAYLAAAANIDAPDAQPRYFYVYAVALESQQRGLEAVKVLQRSNKYWPGQYDTLTSLIVYLEKLGKTQAIPRYLDELERIAPNSPQLKQWRQRYGRAP